MTIDTNALDAVAAGKPVSKKPPREVIYRHTFLVRLTHWLNALAIFIMIGSGLNIFNAHPHLYWGMWGSDVDGRPFFSIDAIKSANAMRGVTTIGPLHIDTTGFLGWSKTGGAYDARGWPDWLTIPGAQDLADARHWHFFFAWVLSINGLAYLAWSLAKRHVQRDLWPTLADLRSIPASVWDHVRLKHPTGESAKRYNVLQRLAYLGLDPPGDGDDRHRLDHVARLQRLRALDARPARRTTVGPVDPLHLRVADRRLHCRPPC